MILPVIRVDRRGKLVHPVQWKDLWFGVGGCGLDLATHAYSWITTKCHDYNNTWCGMSRLDMTRLSRFGRLPLPRPTWGLQRLNTWTTRSRRSSCQGLKVGGLECVLQCTRSQDFSEKIDVKNISSRLKPEISWRKHPVDMIKFVCPIPW